MIAPLLLALIVLAAIPPASVPARAAEITDPGQPAPPMPVPPTPPDLPLTLPRDRSPYPPRATAPPRAPWESKNRIVYAFDRPAAEYLEPRPELSFACRSGRFVQRIDLLYRAFGPRERPLGIAYGKAAINLVDLDRVRQEHMVYFFKDQNTSRCQVFQAPLEDLRQWFLGP